MELAKTVLAGYEMKKGIWFFAYMCDFMWFFFVLFFLKKIIFDIQVKFGMFMKT